MRILTLICKVSYSTIILETKDKMCTQLNKTIDSIDFLGRTKEVKRFLLALLVMSRSHLAYRPISFANEIFYDRLSAQCDGLLNKLRTPDWPEIELEMEEGIKCIKYVKDWQKGIAWGKEREREYQRENHLYFRGINVPFSHLAPVDNLTLNVWSAPPTILIACGQNIGIGDELMFFRVARRLAKKFPNSRIEVSSFHATLWDSCPYVTKRSYPIGNQLVPFVKAKALLEEDPNNLVVFVEFASGVIYRNLELVQGLQRFVYLDSGAKIARIVDQTRSQITEFRVNYKYKIYETISRLLDSIGLDIGMDNNGYELPMRFLAKNKSKTLKKIFINPFSSKDFQILNTDCWANIFKYIKQTYKIKVIIFAGINEQCLQFSEDILKKLKNMVCDAELFGDDLKASIDEAFDAVFKCDLLIGIDTFTSHVNVIQHIPTINIYMDEHALAWSSPDYHVFNARVYDKAEDIGELVERIFSLPKNIIIKEFRSFVKEIDIAVDMINKSILPDNLLNLFSIGENIIAEWLECDPKIGIFFVDIPTSYIEAIKKMVDNYKSIDGSHKKLISLLKDCFLIIKDSNFYKYMKYTLDNSDKTLITI